jgi:two-component system sensor histidine kinase VanS
LGQSQRFVRGGQDRVQAPGAGLGLAIVRAVARAHDAKLELSLRPAGGLRATVRFLPAA